MKTCYDIINKYLKVSEKSIKGLAKSNNITSEQIEKKFIGMSLSKCYNKITLKTAKEVINTLNVDSKNTRNT